MNDHLAVWPQGWTLRGDLDEHSELGLASGEDLLYEANLYWDFSSEDDEVERAVAYTDLLNTLIYNSQIIETDYLIGYVVDVTEEYDWTDEGRARGVYTLKSEDSGEVYAANSSDLARLVKLMKDYTEEAE